MGVQFGFLLLVSIFSTEVRFLKGPSVQQMLCSDLLRERSVLEMVGSDPIVRPLAVTLTAWTLLVVVTLKPLGGAAVVLLPWLILCWVFEVTLSSSLYI